MKVSLRYGRGFLETELPDSNVVKVLAIKPAKPLANPIQETWDRISFPTATPPLAEMAGKASSACVVISDITRPVPNQVLLPPILKTLENAGIKREKIIILIATGLHRSSTPAERLEMCGQEIVDRYRIEDHDATNETEQTYCGQSPNGIPVWVDTRYHQAELKILTGLIEPHLMAGFSGGRKAICPGICGQATIAAWHKPKFLEHEKATNGFLEGNPVHEENTWIAKKAGCDFIVNVVLDSKRRILKAVAGDMVAALEEGVKFARTFVVDTVDEPVDVVITSGAGYPLDTTYYQSVKGIVAALNIVKQGGTIIIASSCTEGLGSKEFDLIAEKFPKIEQFTDAIFKDEFFVLNQWQMEELGKALRKGRVKFYTDALSPEILRKFYVEPIASVEQGIAEAMAQYGPETTIAVLPEGPYVLAELKK